MMHEPDWLTHARELQAIAQIGLAYTKDRFDAERYKRIRAIAAAIMASGSGTEVEQVLQLFCQEIGYATPKVPEMQRECLTEEPDRQEPLDSGTPK